MLLLCTMARLKEDNEPVTMAGLLVRRPAGEDVELSRILI